MSSNTGGQGNNVSGQSPVDEGAELMESEIPKGPMLLSERPTLVGVSGTKVPVTAPDAPAAPFTKIVQLLMSGLAVLSLVLIACLVMWKPHQLACNSVQPQVYGHEYPFGTRYDTTWSQQQHPALPPAPIPSRPIPLPPNYGGLPIRFGKVSCVLQPAHSLNRSQPKRWGVLAVSDDGALAVAGLEGVAMGVWYTSTGKILQVLENFPSQPWDILISSDNKNLIASWGNGVIDIWNLRDNSRKRIVGPFDQDSFWMALSPDGKTLATVSRVRNFMGEIELWDVATGHSKRVLSLKAAEITNLAFSPDGARLAAITSISGQEDEIILCDFLSHSAPLRHMDPHIQISSVAFSPDNKTLVTGAKTMEEHLASVESDDPCTFLYSRIGMVKIWDSHTLAPLDAIPLHAQPVRIAFGKDSHTLLALELGNGERVETVDLSGKQQPQLFYPPEYEHGQSSLSIFGPHLNICFSGYIHGVIKVVPISAMEKERVKT